MNTLKDLDLTQKDFDLLVEGLNELPNKGDSSRLLGGLFGCLIPDGNPEAKASWEKKREEEEQKAEAEKKKIREEVDILKGKLLMFKRYLINAKVLE